MLLFFFFFFLSLSLSLSISFCVCVCVRVSSVLNVEVESSVQQNTFKHHVDVSVMHCDLHPNGASLRQVYLLLDMQRLNYDLPLGYHTVLYTAYGIQVIFIL